MIEITDQNFEKEIQNSAKPVLVDFFAAWCAPCGVLAPTLEKLGKEFEKEINLVKVNLENVPLTAKKFRVEVIPTIVLFKNGKPVSGFVGVQPEQVVREWLEKNLKDENKKSEELIKQYHEYAEKNGFKLNPKKDVVGKIVNGLLENEKKYGLKYCPCRRVSGNPKEDQEKICPCSAMRKDLEEKGSCLCGLFVK